MVAHIHYPQFFPLRSLWTYSRKLPFLPPYTTHIFLKSFPIIIQFSCYYHYLKILLNALTTFGTVELDFLRHFHWAHEEHVFPIFFLNPLLLPVLLVNFFWPLSSQCRSVQSVGTGQVHFSVYDFSSQGLIDHHAALNIINKLMKSKFPSSF